MPQPLVAHLIAKSSCVCQNIKMCLIRLSSSSAVADEMIFEDVFKLRSKAAAFLINLDFLLRDVFACQSLQSDTMI